MDEYLVPSGEAHVEFTEKRSRFLGHIWPVENEEEAIEKIRQMRQKYYDATHNVYAYRIHAGATRYSDDSEPQGTAGMPVLEVLRREQLENICCVITRYFGGILLGAGGLVRAYTRSAKQAIDAAGISKMRLWDALDLPCPYAFFESCKRMLAAADGQILQCEYDSMVHIHCLLPKENTEDFLTKLQDASSGSMRPERREQVYRAVRL